MTQTRPPQRDQQVILQSYVAAQRRLVGDGAIVIRVPGRESMGLSTLGRIVPAPANVLGLIQVRPPPPGDAVAWQSPGGLARNLRRLIVEVLYGRGSG